MQLGTEVNCESTCTYPKKRAARRGEVLNFQYPCAKLNDEKAFKSHSNLKYTEVLACASMNMSMRVWMSVNVQEIAREREETNERAELLVQPEAKYLFNVQDG